MFLLARIAEDSAGDIEPGNAKHIAHWGPARVLTECDVKRRIVELHTGDHECSTYDRHGGIDSCTWVIDDCSTLLLLALSYADHPDYWQEWSQRS